MKKNLLTIVMSIVALTCMTGCTKEKTLPIIEELPTTTKKVEIDKSLITPEEADILEDLIVAACNDAQTKAEKMMSEGMKEVTGGFNFGGIKLPF